MTTINNTTTRHDINNNTTTGRVVSTTTTVKNPTTSRTNVPSASDIIGINTNKIGEMQKAIDDYINIVKSADDERLGISVAVTEKNLKGSNTAKAIKKLGAQIPEQTNSLLKSLTEFKNVLTEVKANYVKQDESSSSYISSEINKIKKS